MIALTAPSRSLSTDHQPGRVIHNVDLESAVHDIHSSKDDMLDMDAVTSDSLPMSVAEV